MSIELRIEGDVAHPRQEVAGFLIGLPDLIQRPDAFVYRDEEEDVQVEFRIAGESEQVTRLNVSVPEQLSPDAANRLADFCEGLATHFAWHVAESATGAPLSDSALRRRLQVVSPAAAPKGCLTALLLCAGLLPAAFLGHFHA